MLLDSSSRATRKNPRINKTTSAIATVTVAIMDIFGHLHF